MPALFNHNTGALRICVDSTEGGLIRGRILGQRLTGPIPFSDLHGLLLQTEGVLDLHSFPQTFERSRTFSPKRQPPPLPVASTPGEGLSEEIVAAARGQVSTFQLYVLARRHSTWQGFVNWLDGTPSENYQSVWELIQMLERRIPGLSPTP